MILKDFTKKILKKFPSNIRHRMSKTIVLSLGFDQEPTFNMFYHITLVKNIGFVPDLVIDIGAYKGEWTKNTLNIFPNASFIMIEAQASKKDYLEKIINTYKNVSLELCLLGESKKKAVSFYEMETGSSIYEENSRHIREKTFLDMKSLDDVIKDYSKNKKCFLKIDVQGAEIDVLKGASQVLNTTEFILLEVSTLNYNQNAPQFSDVILFLKEKGFVLFDICDMQRMNNILFQADLLFIKESSPLREKVNFKSIS